jgi:hypothetical protein
MAGNEKQPASKKNELNTEHVAAKWLAEGPGFERRTLARTILARVFARDPRL